MVASFASPLIPFACGRGGSGRSSRRGDRQAPEGFYTVACEQLNPNTQGRTGSSLMVHGGCSSIGCYAMTHAVVDEIWRLVTAALDQGQPRVPVHVFPVPHDGPKRLAAAGFNVG